MTEGFGWKHEQGSPRALYRLWGCIDEDADLEPLCRAVAKHRGVTLDLGDIERMNSCGIREWIRFVRTLTDIDTLEIIRCSPFVVAQMNTIANFSGPAIVSSVLAPFVCDECGHSVDILLDLKDRQPPRLPELDCERCETAMIFDDIPETYFSFLR